MSVFDLFYILPEEGLIIWYLFDSRSMTFICHTRLFRTARSSEVRALFYLVSWNHLSSCDCDLRFAIATCYLLNANKIDFTVFIFYNTSNNNMRLQFLAIFSLIGSIQAVGSLWSIINIHQDDDLTWTLYLLFHDAISLTILYFTRSCSRMLDQQQQPHQIQ